jgi:hypothetical protein
MKLRSFVIEKPAGLSNAFAIVRKNSTRQLAVGSRLSNKLSGPDDLRCARRVGRSADSVPMPVVRASHCVAINRQSTGRLLPPATELILIARSEQSERLCQPPSIERMQQPLRREAEAEPVRDECRIGALRRCAAGSCLSSRRPRTPCRRRNNRSRPNGSFACAPRCAGHWRYECICGTSASAATGRGREDAAILPRPRPDAARFDSFISARSEQDDA